MLLWKVLLDYFMDSFSVCMKVFVSYVIMIELMQQSSLYMQMKVSCGVRKHGKQRNEWLVEFAKMLWCHNEGMICVVQGF